MVRGKYRIDAFIAAGSMSTVYAATHRNGSRVALKILLKELARDTSFAERFRREGYFGNSIIHPGIVRAIDDDMTDDGCSFLVFELLEGETLEQKRERIGGRLPVNEVLAIGDTLLDILAAAHDHQILHRDLKPDNVFMTAEGAIKLLDFGIARLLDHPRSTPTGDAMGTAEFMAPEQARGRAREADARADVYAVGAMMFSLLTGEYVHHASNSIERLIRVATEPAPAVRSLRSDLTEEIAHVIDLALSFRREERWHSARAMMEALDQALSQR